MEKIGNEVELHLGNALAVLPTLLAKSVRCCVTSPPYYGLRDYGNPEQIGLETTPGEYVDKLVQVFGEVRRVLTDDGTLWVNLGDSYAGRGATGGKSSLQPSSSSVADRGWIPAAPGFKDKDLYGIPWRVAFALQDDGWYLRSDIIWSKPNPMPESVTDRCTKAHEYLFMLAKSERYYFNAGAIEEKAAYAGQPRGGSKNRYEQNNAGMDCKVFDTRNKRDVWTVAPERFDGAHFAVMPQKLVEPCILAGSEAGDLILDPFGGAGTVGVVAMKKDRRSVLIELNPEFLEIAKERLLKTTGTAAGTLFAGA